MMIRHERALWPPTPLNGGFRPGLWLVCLAGLLGLVFWSTALGLGLLMGGAAIAGALAWLVWQRPYAGLLILIVGGAFHQLIMLLIFHATRLPLLVKACQLWKELVVIILLLKVIDLAFRRRESARLYLLDLLIGIFLVYGLIYLVYPSSVADSTLFSQVMGLRANAFFFLAYFVGRGLVLTVAQLRRALVIFCGIAGLTALISLMQFVLPGVSNELLNALSFADFMESQRGDQGVQFAVRNNQIMGALIPRASSIFLSDLGLAFYTLLAAPLATAIFIHYRRIEQFVIGNSLLLATVGTAVLTVTRSAILALVPALLAMFIWSRSLVVIMIVAIEVAVGLLGVIAYLNLSPAVLSGLFSLDESSAQGHLLALEMSVKVMREEPFGRGLGTAGQVAQRFISQGGLTNESWYFQIGTEMGLPAALIFGLIVVGLAVVAFQRYYTVTGAWSKALCLGIAGSTIAYAIVGATLHVWENLTVSIVFWLLAGIVVRIGSVADGPQGEGR